MYSFLLFRLVLCFVFYLVLVVSTAGFSFVAIGQKMVLIVADSSNSF